MAADASGGDWDFFEDVLPNDAGPAAAAQATSQHLLHAHRLHGLCPGSSRLQAAPWQQQPEMERGYCSQEQQQQQQQQQQDSGHYAAASPGAAANGYLDVTREIIGGEDAEEFLGPAEGGREAPLLQAVRVQMGLSRADVLVQIEEFIISSAEELAEGRLPVISMVSRAASNVLAAGTAAEEAEEAVEGAQAAVAAGVQQLGGRRQVRTLTHNRGAGAAGYARGRAGGGRAGCAHAAGRLQLHTLSASQQRQQQRAIRRTQRETLSDQYVRHYSLLITSFNSRGLIYQLPARLPTCCRAGRSCSLRAVFKVLDVIHELLSSGRQATQRDAYYKVVMMAAVTACLVLAGGWLVVAWQRAAAATLLSGHSSITPHPR
jgi:hypothetical protein